MFSYRNKGYVVRLSRQSNFLTHLNVIINHNFLYNSPSDLPGYEDDV